MKAELLYSGPGIPGSRNTGAGTGTTARSWFWSPADGAATSCRAGSLSADPGGVFVIPPGLPHRQIDFGEVGTVYLVFEPADTAFDLSFRVIDASRDAFVPVWIGQIDALYRAESAGGVRRTPPRCCSDTCTGSKQP